MLLRVILGGILGGLATFFGGFVTHMIFDWSGRTFSKIPNEPAMRQFFAQEKLAPGVYSFPEMDRNIEKSQQEAEYERINKLYKEGPAAFIVVPPAGEDMMSGATLGMECLTNIMAALLAAAVVSQAADRSFLTRWGIVFIMGVAAWFSLSASYAIWYRFPFPFIRDELLCTAFESMLSGVVIAAIVKSKAEVKATAPVAQGR